MQAQIHDFLAELKTACRYEHLRMTRVSLVADPARVEPYDSVENADFLIAVRRFPSQGRDGHRLTRKRGDLEIPPRHP